jgi:hypothetical protein
MIQLFDYYFGFLCVQILASSLQLDVLVRLDRLESTVKELPATIPTGMFSSVSATSAIKLIVPFGWPHDIDEYQHTLLLFALWKSRTALFEVCKRVPNMHGWEILFAAIWVPLLSGRLGYVLVLFLFTLLTKRLQKCDHFLAAQRSCLSLFLGLHSSKDNRNRWQDL